MAIGDDHGGTGIGRLCLKCKRDRFFAGNQVVGLLRVEALDGLPVDLQVCEVRVRVAVADNHQEVLLLFPIRRRHIHIDIVEAGKDLDLFVKAGDILCQHFVIDRDLHARVRVLRGAAQRQRFDILRHARDIAVGGKGERGGQLLFAQFEVGQPRIGGLRQRLIRDCHRIGAGRTVRCGHRDRQLVFALLQRQACRIHRLPIQSKGYLRPFGLRLRGNAQFRRRAICLIVEVLTREVRGEGDSRAACLLQG